MKADVGLAGVDPGEMQGLPVLHDMPRAEAVIAWCICQEFQPAFVRFEDLTQSREDVVEIVSLRHALVYTEMWLRLQFCDACYQTTQVRDREYQEFGAQ